MLIQIPLNPAESSGIAQRMEEYQPILKSPDIMARQMFLLH